MHSSRMRSLTVCWRLLRGGGFWSGGGVCSGGGVSSWGVSSAGDLVPGLCVCSGGWQSPPPPPVDRITDACRNITLAQLRCGR